MALVEAARFHTLSEAHVATALLRSAGIPASLSDTHYGSVFWMEQAALGGFRISVPEQDLADTVALLDVPSAPADPEDEPEPPAADTGRRTLAVALLVLLGPAAGWLVAKRRRFGPSSGEVVAGSLMSLTGLLAVGGGLVLLIVIVVELLTNAP